MRDKAGAMYKHTPTLQALTRLHTVIYTLLSTHRIIIPHKNICVRVWSLWRRIWWWWRNMYYHLVLNGRLESSWIMSHDSCWRFNQDIKSWTNRSNKKEFVLTSSITQHIWWIHWVIASDVPVKVTARSVEFGNISLATWIEHPVTSRISLIFEPPFPIMSIIGVVVDVVLSITDEVEETRGKEKRKTRWTKDWKSFSENPFKSLKIMEKNGGSLEIWFSLLLILYVGFCFNGILTKSVDNLSAMLFDGGK